MPYIYGDQSLYEEGDFLHFHNSHWITRGHLAEGDIAGGNVGAFAFNWQNPHSHKILITRKLLHLTVAGGTAGGELDVGVAAGTGVHSDNLIDGLDPDQTGVFDNIEDKGANGKSRQIVDENGGANDWITCQILLQNEGALDGKFYIEYTEVI